MSSIIIMLLLIYCVPSLKQSRRGFALLPWQENSFVISFLCSQAAVFSDTCWATHYIEMPVIQWQGFHSTLMGPNDIPYHNSRSNIFLCSIAILRSFDLSDHFLYKEQCSRSCIQKSILRENDLNFHQQHFQWFWARKLPNARKWINAHQSFQWRSQRWLTASVEGAEKIRGLGPIGFEPPEHLSVVGLLYVKLNFWALGRNSYLAHHHHSEVRSEGLLSVINTLEGK
jgi:hypothetical protein